MLFKFHIVFCSVLFCVQSNPINTKVVGQDGIDDLVERSQKLLKTVESKLDGEVRVLEDFIADIVITAISTREQAREQLDDDVYQLARAIEIVISAAEDEDINVSSCVGNSIADIQEKAETAEKNVISYIEKSADTAVQYVNSYIIDCNKELDSVENCLAKVQECKLKEDIERAICRADQSVNLEKLESNVPINIDRIITNSSEYYKTILDDIKQYTNTYLEGFLNSNMKVVDEVFKCANMLLPTPIPVPWLTTTVTSTSSTTEDPTWAWTEDTTTQI